MQVWLVQGDRQPPRPLDPYWQLQELLESIRRVGQLRQLLLLGPLQVRQVVSQVLHFYEKLECTAET